MTKIANPLDFGTAGAAKKKAPKAVADAAAGMLLASVEVVAPPERAFAALMTGEVERWWKLPGVFRLKDWRADLCPQGDWSVCVAFDDGRRFDQWGEICAVEAPNRVALTRHFAANPLIGERETTIAYRFEPSPYGTLITLREDGFLGRPAAAHSAPRTGSRSSAGSTCYLSEPRVRPYQRPMSAGGLSPWSSVGKKRWLGGLRGVGAGSGAGSGIVTGAPGPLRSSGPGSAGVALRFFGVAVAGRRLGAGFAVLRQVKRAEVEAAELVGASATGGASWMSSPSPLQSVSQIS